jgi:hypothetical protein
MSTTVASWVAEQATAAAKSANAAAATATNAVADAWCSRKAAADFDKDLLTLDRAVVASIRTVKLDPKNSVPAEPQPPPKGAVARVVSALQPKAPPTYRVVPDSEAFAHAFKVEGGRCVEKRQAAVDAYVAGTLEPVRKWWAEKRVVASIFADKKHEAEEDLRCSLYKTATARGVITGVYNVDYRTNGAGYNFSNRSCGGTSASTV